MQELNSNTQQGEAPGETASMHLRTAGPRRWGAAAGDSARQRQLWEAGWETLLKLRSCHFRPISHPWPTACCFTSGMESTEARAENSFVPGQHKRLGV